MTRRTKASWSNFFDKGKHPCYGSKCWHDIAIRRLNSATGVKKLRDNFLKGSRARRLMSKSKPGVAAAAGVVSDGIPDNQDEEQFHECEDYEEFSDPFETLLEEHTAPAVIQIDEEMKAEIEERRRKAITKRAQRMLERATIVAHQDTV